MAPTFKCPCGKKFAAQGYLTRHHSSDKCEDMKKREERIHAATLRDKTSEDVRAKRRRIEISGSLDPDIEHSGSYRSKGMGSRIREELQQGPSGHEANVRLEYFLTSICGIYF